MLSNTGTFRPAFDAVALDLTPNLPVSTTSLLPTPILFAGLVSRQERRRP
jgi:hypothetical protein